MSKELEHEAPDLAMYDTMTTQELEDLLRSDVDAPEGQGPDEETLLHIMEVLAQRDQTDVPGMAARRSWASFLQHYLSDIETPEEKEPEKRLHIRPRRWLVAAAVIALLVSIPLTVCALTWDKDQNVFATWKDGVFFFAGTEDTVATQPQHSISLRYTSLQEAMEDIGFASNIVPTWIPDDYTLADISVSESPKKRSIHAIYTKGDSVLNISVSTFLSSDPLHYEVDDDLLELYHSAGTDYYIFRNDETLSAIWFDEPYECNISGDLTLHEIKTMIDSIRKGT